jgi:hypothetical protein
MADNRQPVAVISRLLDLSERRVQQLVRDGIIPKPERGRYDLIGAVRGYVRYLRDLVLKAEAGVADYGSERARLIKARADLAEMEAARRRAELLPAAEVAAAWTEILALVRARVLALPDKLAPLTHETTSIAEARGVLRTAVREVLAEIAATEVVLADPPGPSGPGGTRAGGAEGGDAAAGPDDQPVGGPLPEA